MSGNISKEKIPNPSNKRKTSFMDKHMRNASIEKRKNIAQSVNHNSSDGNVGVPEVIANFHGDHLISASFASYVYNIFYH